MHNAHGGSKYICRIKLGTRCVAFEQKENRPSRSVEHYRGLF